MIRIGLSFFFVVIQQVSDLSSETVGRGSVALSAPTWSPVPRHTADPEQVLMEDQPPLRRKTAFGDIDTIFFP